MFQFHYKSDRLAFFTSSSCRYRFRDPEAGRGNIFGRRMNIMFFRWLLSRRVWFSFTLCSTSTNKRRWEKRWPIDCSGLLRKKTKCIMELTEESDWLIEILFFLKTLPVVQKLTNRRNRTRPEERKWVYYCIYVLRQTILKHNFPRLDHHCRTNEGSQGYRQTNMNRFKKVHALPVPTDLENITDDELEEYKEAFRLFDKVRSNW